jgi:apolipoprotein N-acyltransferase
MVEQRIAPLRRFAPTCYLYRNMRGKLFLLSFLSAALLTAAWPPWGFAPLLFIAFVPLIYVQQIISSDNRLRARHLFFYSYITFVTWNALTTWWIWFASPGGACMAILANALLMALVFLLFHKMRRALPERFATFSLIPVWIAFEYFHLDWDLTWPWLTLGNGFAGYHTWIQWYEYTGIFGGSFWILLVNVIVFDLFFHRNTLLREPAKRTIWIAALSFIILFPMIFSLIRYNTFDVQEDSLKPVKVVVVQPNVDPYEKFNGDFRGQLESMLLLAEMKLDSTTEYLVFPETALTESFWEETMTSTWSFHRLGAFLESYPNLTIVTGATTGKEYPDETKRSATARKYKEMTRWFDVYNTAMQVDCTGTMLLYHKSKLVPGVEKMPFPQVLGFLDKLAIDMGGTVGSLGMQEERTVFTSRNNTKIAPVICYESVYGDYVGQYIRNGANYIFIITNDGWWGDTPGYKQHLLYGRLRAIETRKGIARSANTGISCFIDQRGDILQAQAWWVPAAISDTVYSKADQTFYTRFGDYIGAILFWITWGLVAFTVYKWWRKRSMGKSHQSLGKSNA